MNTYHFNLTSVDKKPITELTKVLSLQIKTYKLPQAGKEVILWYKREDTPNPEDIINPAIRMLVKETEEVEPNTFVVKDIYQREFLFKLLYTEDKG